MSLYFVLYRSYNITAVRATCGGPGSHGLSIGSLGTPRSCIHVGMVSNLFTLTVQARTRPSSTT